MVPNCRILDTTHLFPHPAGPPYKNSLRYLAQHYLKRSIQTGEHDSAEDALTSAHLVGLKLLHGPSFGLSSRINILTLLPSYLCNDPTAPEELRSKSAPVSIVLFDEAASMRSYASPQCNLITTHGDDDTVKKVVKHFVKREREVPSAVFVAFVHLQECDISSVSRDAASEVAKAQTINDRVMSMVESAPDDTLVNIIAANCRPGNGNQLSKAHGMLFSFVKDKKGRGPTPCKAGVPQNGCQQS